LVQSEASRGVFGNKLRSQPGIDLRTWEVCCRRAAKAGMTRWAIHNKLPTVPNGRERAANFRTSLPRHLDERYPGATAWPEAGLGETMEYVRVQLKVCEGCGGLWFRTQSAEDVYGRCCAGKLAQHARAKREQRQERRAKRHQMSLLQAVVMGGTN
jgi:hypothetical protein